MEQERIAREKEEKEKAEKAQKMKETFGDANSQWEKDKAAMQNIALNEKKSGDKKAVEKITPRLLALLECLRGRQDKAVEKFSGAMRRDDEPVSVNGPLTSGRS